MRVALVHDWLNGMRGGEKVFEVLCELFPHASVFTLFYEPAKVSSAIRDMRVHESALAHLPFARSKYRYLLPLMPGAIEAMRIEGFDLVISTSHCVAKGAIPRPENTPHICYCFTPMRYVWEKYDDYFGHRIGIAPKIMTRLRPRLQAWDVASAARINSFMTTSNYVAQRIRKHYGRHADVIPAPVDCSRFSLPRQDDSFYLVVSALEPYKRIDIAVEAFNQLALPLKIAGTGTQLENLRASAKPNIEFLGWVNDEELALLYSRATALVFPPDEDFGIVPLEASAAGCPVIAFACGGAIETVIPTITGIFFKEQTAASLIEALNLFRPQDFHESHLRKHALKFDRAVFKQRLADAITKHYEQSRTRQA